MLRRPTQRDGSIAYPVTFQWTRLGISVTCKRKMTEERNSDWRLVMVLLSEWVSVKVRATLLSDGVKQNLCKFSEAGPTFPGWNIRRGSGEL